MADRIPAIEAEAVLQFLADPTLRERVYGVTGLRHRKDIGSQAFADAILDALRPER